MTEQQDNELFQDTEQEKNKREPSEEAAAGAGNIEELKKSLEEANDKYIRLYADFENYRKVTARNKEELLKYANEDLMTDILTVIDHLELALQHSPGSETPNSLAEGVELTLKELKSVLEKHGLITIDALGKPFDPSVHHAMSRIESEDADENTVVKEFRKGYMLRDRVLRAALVGVAKKPDQSADPEPGNTQNQPAETEEK
ncbi:MAG TPA: nucleotide exchange factor GrpE [Nitrospirae bacterium]|nr:nucleotide exchange factor GrpE [Nitrospirota bacterium]